MSQEPDRRLRAATDDPQWIHTNPCVRGRGKAVRDDHHARLPDAVAVRPDASRGAPPPRGMVVNYGVDRARFPAPVTSGVVVDANVECEGVDKPVCVAELVVLTVP